MWLRIWALALRYVYLHKRSPARIMEVVFWPVMGLLVWGFFTKFVDSIARPGALSFLLGGLILWEVLYRAQQAVSYSITEEFWVRNILNLFITPLSMTELVAATCLLGAAKSMITTLVLMLLAQALYSFELLKAGWVLAPFYGCLLLFGWSVGMMTMSLIFRFGRAAEALIWGIPFLMQPLAAVFYPVHVLPGWLQAVSWCLPATYVFEGLRAAYAGGGVDAGFLAGALLLNIPWLAAGGLVFALALRRAREQGSLGRQVVD